MVWNLFGSDESPGPANSGGGKVYAPKHKNIIGDDIENTIDEALECDYERDCTTLYRKVEDEEWGYVTKFLDTGYWPGSFFADDVAPTDQARTWVTRFDPHDAKKVRWSQLPLHLAIVVDAPYDIVGRLIELYPQAVRCTDDQHMLPLHLAMRHGSSDRIVDLLLAAFPEAVNARGKNDRTPIECAIRGPNKVRGRILGAFVEKSKAKATKSAVSAYTREIAHLKAQLEDKESELGDVRSKLLALDTAKASIEFELNQKISELKVSQAKMASTAAKRVEKVESARLMEELEIQKKINELETEKQQLEVAQQKAKEEELGLRKELETVQLHVVQSTSPDDLYSLKEEVKSLKAYRLEHSRSQAKEDMEALKTQLANEVKKADGATRNELKVMQKTIDELRTVSTKAKSNDDITALKAELDALRQELKEREEASRTKEDLVMLKKQLEKELKDTENKTSEQIAAIQAAIKDMNIVQLETKTHAELTALKKELEALKQDKKERELEKRTKKDLEELKEQVNEQLKCSEGKTKMELQEMKKSVESININDLETKTNEELITVKRGLEDLKEQLQKKEEANKVKVELAVLRQSLEIDLLNSSGNMEHVHIQAMQMAVKRTSAPSIESKTAEELIALKEEIESLKDAVKLKEEAKEASVELEMLKAQVDEEMKVSEDKTKDELLAIKNAVDKINMTDIESKDREQFDAFKQELVSVRQRLVDKQVAKQHKLDLMVMRMKLETELAHTQNPVDVAALQKSIDNLEDSKLQDKSAEELSGLKQEVSALKQEIKEKGDAVKDVENLKKAVEDKLAASEGKSTEELQALKTAVDAIDLKKVQSQSRQEWLSMKEEIAVLKREIHNTELAETIKAEVSKLKQALEEDMKHAAGSTKEDLVKMKSAVDSIDLKKLETADQPAWDNLKSDVDSLNRQLKVKECEGLMSNMNEALKNSKSMSRLEINRIRRLLSEVDVSKLESMSYNDLCAKKREIESIREEIDADAVAKPHKTEKKGFRKMLQRFAFGLKKANKSDSTPSTPETNRSEAKTDFSDDPPAGLVMPPCMVSGKRSIDADSDVDSEEDSSRKIKSKQPGGLPPRHPSSKTTLASVAIDPPKLVQDCCNPNSVRSGSTTVDTKKHAAGEAKVATAVVPSDPTPPCEADPTPSSAEACGIQSLITVYSKDSLASAKSKKLEGAVPAAKGDDDAATVASKRSTSSKRSAVSSKRSVSSSKKSSGSKSSKSSRKRKTLKSAPSPPTSRSGTPNPASTKPNSRPVTPARSDSPDSANDTAPESPVTPVPKMTDALSEQQPAQEEAIAELSNQTMVNETGNGELEVEIAPVMEEAPTDQISNITTQSFVAVPISAASP